MKKLVRYVPVVFVLYALAPKVAVIAARLPSPKRWGLPWA